LIGLVFIYPDETLIFSYSHLGKFIAILFVIFTTAINVVYGAFLCALFILYYQSDMVEGMESYGSNVLLPVKTESNIATQNGEIVEKNQKNNNKKSYEFIDFIPDPPDPDFVIDLENTGLGEPFSYTARDAFRKKYCSNGELNGEIHNEIYSKVKHEFADAIFPGLEFKYENRCNPCDTNCDFKFDEQLEYSLI
jgi:hypothetical protein